MNRPEANPDLVRPTSWTPARPTPASVSRARNNRNHRKDGFTLIECIGVVTVIALVAAMLVPAVIRRIDQAARDRDAAELATMADALKNYVLKTKTIPSNLPGAISTNMALPLTLISKTPRKTDRTFMIDPSFSVSGGLPYKQTTAGTAKPSSARMMILSTLESNSPSGNFDTLWNTVDTAALRIKRVNLEPLFHQVLLVNRDALNPKFSIDANSNYDLVPSGVGTNTYYLEGSMLGLYATNSTPLLTARHLLTSSIGFVFEGGSWHAQIVGTNSLSTSTNNNNTSQAFAATAAAFFATNWNPGADLHGGQSANQSAALAAMYNFMSDYTLWANTTPTNFFRFGTSGGQMNSFPIYELLSGAAGNLDNYTGTGNSGLLHQ